MFGKRSVVRTDGTRRKTETPFRDPGAMSGVLTGVLALAGLRIGELPQPVAITVWSRRPRASCRRSTSSGRPRDQSYSRRLHRVAAIV